MRRSLCAVVAAASLAGLVGCGAASRPTAASKAPGSRSGTPVAPGATTSGSAARGGDRAPAGTTPTASGARSTVAPAAGAPGVASSPSTKAGTAPGRTAPSPTYATAAQLPVDVVLSPKCVTPGATMRLTVTTNAKASVGFVAVYAGNKSGAAPPFGEGYGGNDAGQANDQGSYTNSWVVSLTAPSGPGHVLLGVAWKGMRRKLDVPFSVGGREAGGCGT